MLKIATAGVTALFISASSLAYAQVPGAADTAKFPDARIEIVKLALQLTPEQMKFWPAIEQAIQSRSENRQARIATKIETVGARRDAGVLDTLRNRDPVAFLNQRADALAQRSSDLKQWVYIDGDPRKPNETMVAWESAPAQQKDKTIMIAATGEMQPAATASTEPANIFGGNEKIAAIAVYDAPAASVEVPATADEPAKNPGTNEKTAAASVYESQPL